jgi:GAF domain-containing protein
MDPSADEGLRRIAMRLEKVLERDALVRTTVFNLRAELQTDRIVLYYFYSKWEGQVTFEALSPSATSIIGSRGPDECFNQDYAAMYEAGRVRAIADLMIEPIQDCHRDFLLNLGVRSNLVVPVLNANGLWGLLIAHHCQAPRLWTDSEVQIMQQGASVLAQSPTIQQG